MLTKRNLIPLVKVLGIVILAVTMMVYPQDVLASAAQGLAAWAKYVLPALLPFFMLSELMLGAGIVHMLGVLLEPVMRPIFRLPGSSAFVVAMGYTSGPPIGAVITAKLYKDNLLTRTEAERLVAFTNNASPGFMLGAVAAGMFGNPGLGIILAFSNYLANLILGIGLRYYGGKETTKPSLQRGGAGIWRRSFRAMVAAQRRDGRPLGQMIGDAVKGSVNTILIVGGFILFFAVLLRILAILGILHGLTSVLHLILTPLGLHPSLLPAVSNGLVEVTLGAKATAESSASLRQQLLVVSAILGWSGISVHAQVASFLSGTGIRLTPFVLGRVVHSLLAMGLTGILLQTTATVPVFGAVSSRLPFWQTESLALILAMLAALSLLTIWTMAVYLVKSILLKRTF